jgi:glycerol-3-phosphate dehydrogenase
VSERRILMDIAPHLVNPLGFLFPVYKGDRRGLSTITAGMILYDGLSLFRSPKLHRRLNKKQVGAEEPTLRQDGLKGAPLYYDCSTDDARLTLENALDAADHGAVVATHASVVGFLRDENGRIEGAVVRDRFTGEEKEIRANVVINATGPWTDSILRLAGKEEGDELLRTTKGIHIVVSAEKLPVKHAVVCFHPLDGRVLFAIPWGDVTYIGTTDTDYDGDPADVAAEASDVDYLLDCLEKYFPEHPVTREDVTCTWAGLRPLVRPPSKKGTEVDESSVSREHRIVVSEDGLLTIAGGKLTTYRLMSKEVVGTATKLLRLSGHLDRRLKSARTEDDPLPGAVNWPEDDDHSVVASWVRDAGGPAVSEETALLLADTYGTRGQEVARLVRQDPALAGSIVEGRPEILAQVDWAVQHELAATVVDVMKQRMQLFYRDPDQGLAGADVVARRMAELLDWSDAERETRLAEYREEVALSRRWRSEATPPPEPPSAP